jgi:hypothetical protein
MISPEGTAEAQNLEALDVSLHHPPSDHHGPRRDGS